jgi:hypothetical protein
MEKKKEDEEELIVDKEILGSIVNEKTQLAARIPAIIVKEFEINPKEDGIHWIVLKSGNEISLHASLKKGAFKDDKK